MTSSRQPATVRLCAYATAVSEKRGRSIRPAAHITGGSCPVGSRSRSARTRPCSSTGVDAPCRGSHRVRDATGVWSASPRKSCDAIWGPPRWQERKCEADGREGAAHPQALREARGHSERACQRIRAVRRIRLPDCQQEVLERCRLTLTSMSDCSTVCMRQGAGRLWRPLGETHELRGKPKRKSRALLRHGNGESNVK